MHPSRVIADYLEALERELSFDPALARRLRHEVEDHLVEAVAAIALEPGPRTAPEAERMVVARFGAPHEIAAQFAPASLIKQSKSVGAMILLVVLGVFVMMKTRVAWLAAVGAQAGSGPELRSTLGLIGSVDRCAFFLALLVGFSGWICAYWSSSRSDAEWWQRTQRCVTLCAGAAMALAASVGADIALMAVRLSATPWSAPLVASPLSIGVEVGLLAIVVAHLRTVRRRATTVASRFLI